MTRFFSFLFFCCPCPLRWEALKRGPAVFGEEVLSTCSLITCEKGLGFLCGVRRATAERVPGNSHRTNLVNFFTLARNVMD